MSPNSLKRKTITVASRVMLPTYVIFFAIVGTNFLVAPLSRLLESPGLAYAHDITNVRAWGFLFLSSSILILVAMKKNRRDLCMFALTVAGIVAGLWMVFMGLAAIFGEASPSAWAWPFLVMRATRASYKSLGKREK